MSKFERLHVIVLAGDEDSRLNSLTRVLTGEPLPKQFAPIAGDTSLLQRTVACYARVVPTHNIVVVVGQTHASLACRQLQAWSGIGILARTLNRGPAVDTLLALGRVVARNPDAAVVVAPCHHFLAEPRLLVSALTTTALAAHTAPVVLAGAARLAAAGDEGDAMDDSLGDSLIVPGARLDGRLRAVSRLVDRPSPSQLHRLRARGALWDTGTFAAHASDLWRMAERSLPAEATMVAHLWSGRTASLSSVEAVFRHMPTGKVTSRLWQGPRDLAVLPIHGAGWSAWRSPEEVLDSIGDSMDLERLLSRIYRGQQASDRARVAHGMAL